jgi:hypothetical protein
MSEPSMTDLLRQAARRNTGTSPAFSEPADEPTDEFESVLAEFHRAERWGTEGEIVAARQKVQSIIDRHAQSSRPAAADFGAGARPSAPTEPGMGELLRAARYGDHFRH